MARHPLMRFLTVVVTCSLFVGVLPGMAVAQAVDRVSLIAHVSTEPASFVLSDPSSLRVGDAFAVWVVATGVFGLQAVDLLIDYPPDVLDVEQYLYVAPNTHGGEFRDRIIPGMIQEKAVDLGSVDRETGQIQYVASNTQPADDDELILLQVGFTVVGSGTAYVRFAEGSPLFATDVGKFHPNNVDILGFWVGDPGPGPAISVSGVADLAWYKDDVTPVVSVTGGTISSLTLSKDNGDPVAFWSDTSVTEEGSYALDVSAVSPSGALSILSLAFKIDKTKPEINVTGVTDGALMKGSATPVIQASDNMDGGVFLDATLKKDVGDAEPFQSGTTISGEGTYVLTVNATDAAGNLADTIAVNFVIEGSPPTPVLVDDGSFTFTVLRPEGRYTLTQSQRIRIHGTTPTITLSASKDGEALDHASIHAIPSGAFWPTDSGGSVQLRADDFAYEMYVDSQYIATFYLVDVMDGEAVVLLQASCDTDEGRAYGVRVEQGRAGMLYCGEDVYAYLTVDPTIEHEPSIWGRLPSGAGFLLSQPVPAGVLQPYGESQHINSITFEPDVTLEHSRISAQMNGRNISELFISFFNPVSNWEGWADVAVGGRVYLSQRPHNVIARGLDHQGRYVCLASEGILIHSTTTGVLVSQQDEDLAHLSARCYGPLGEEDDSIFQYLILRPTGCSAWSAGCDRKEQWVTRGKMQVASLYLGGSLQDRCVFANSEWGTIVDDTELRAGGPLSLTVWARWPDVYGGIQVGADAFDSYGNALASGLHVNGILQDVGYIIVDSEQNECQNGRFRWHPGEAFAMPEVEAGTYSVNCQLDAGVFGVVTGSAQYTITETIPWPVVVSIDPPDGASGVPLGSTVKVMFSRMPRYNYHLSLTSGANPVEGYWMRNDANRTVTFVTTGSLDPLQAYTVLVMLMDADGGLLRSIETSFTTGGTEAVLSGVEDGAWYKDDVTPIVEIAGGSVSSLILSKDSEEPMPFVSGTAVTGEGSYVLRGSVLSSAGVAGEFSRAFKIDKTKPEVSVSEIANGTITSQSVTPIIQVTDNMDENASAQATLTKGAGAPEVFVSGTEISDDGVYVLTVSAVDAAGNQANSVVVGFEIYSTPPEITVSGADDGAWYQDDVQLIVDTIGGTVQALTLSKNDGDAEPFLSGTAVTKEGSYVLFASALNPAGVLSEFSLAFKIDRTNPQVSLQGIEDGIITSKSVTPIIQATDNMDDGVAALVTLKKDSMAAESFVSGTVVSDVGAYVLTAYATDAAGNKADTVRVTFEIVDEDCMPTVDRVSLVAHVSTESTSFVLSDPSSLRVGDTFAVWVVATGASGLQAVDLLIDYPPDVLDVEQYLYVAPNTHGEGFRDRIIPGMIQEVAVDLGSVDRETGQIQYVASNTQPADDDELILLQVGFTVVGSGTAYVRFAEGSPLFATDGGKFHPNNVDILGFWVGDPGPGPAISVSGVADLAWYKDDVTPVVSVTGGTISSLTLSKDNGDPVAFWSDTSVTEEGSYVLDVSAVSPSGALSILSLAFRIDKTKPVVAIADVEDGDITSLDVTPDITVSDEMDKNVVAEATLEKDGGSAEPFASGTVVSDEGIYVLTVNATDAAGNQADRVVVNFTIDKTVPVVTVTASPIYAKVGPVAIVATSTKVLGQVPVLTITPMNGVPSSVSLQMKTEPGVTPVQYEGVYQVEEDTPEGVAQVTLDAVDVAGNVSGDTTTFTVDRTCELTMVYHDAPAVLGPGASFHVFAVGEPDAQSVTVDLTGLASVGEPVALQEGEGGTYYSQAFQTRQVDTFDAFLSVDMVDRAENSKSVVTARKLVVDTQGPTLSHPAVEPRLAKGGSTVHIEVQSSERVNAQVSIGSIISGKPMTCAPKGDHWLCVADIVVPTGVDGEFSVTIGASDLGGNTVTLPVGELILDNVAPNPRILVTSGTRGTSGFYTSPVSVQIDCDGADAGEAIINYTIKRNDGEPQSDEFTASPPTGSQGPIDLTFNEDGKWSVTVTAVDGATNVSRQVTQHIQIDKTPPGVPLVTVKTVDGGTLVAGDDGKIRTAQHSVDVLVNTPAGSDEPLLYAEITVNGAQEGFKVVPAEGYTHRVKLNTTGIGKNTLKVLLVDRAGSQGSSWNCTVITDIVPPAFALEFAHDSSTAMVTATASELLSQPPVVTLSVGVGEEAVVLAEAQPMAADGTDLILYTHSVSLTPEQLLLMAQGVSVNVTGQDAAGNKGSSTLTTAKVSDAGGIVGSEAAEATVEEGTFDEETEINISSLPTTVDDDNTAIAAVALSATKVSTGEDAGTFTNPVTVTLRISVPSGVDPDIFADKTRLGIQVGDENGIPSYFEPVVGVDIEAPPTKELSIDRTVLYITARFLHFSEWAVLLDNTPPVLTVSAPGQNDTVSTTQGLVGGKVRVSFSVTDTQSSPMEVEVRLNGAIIATLEDVEGEAQVDIDLLDSNWVVGPNTVQVAATDSSGNSATKEVSVHYDVTPPAVALDPVISPSNASSVTISGSVGVVDAGAAVSVERGDGLWSVTIDADSEGLFSVTAPLEEGTNTFTVTAVDLAGNMSDSSLVTVVRDTVAPAITARVPRVTAVAVVDVTGSVDEPVSAVTVSLDGEAAVAATITGTSFSATLDLGVTGEHTIEIIATDSAGNQASKSHTVQYDPDVPVINVTSDIPTLTNGVEITVEGTSDPGATVTVTLDGEILGVVSLPGDGAFSVQVPLPDPDGDKTLTIRSLNPTNGLYAESVFTIERDTVAPVVTVDPATPQSTNTSTATIAGSTNETITGLSVNGVNKDIGADGRSFTVAVTLTPGQNTFTIHVTDRAGNAATHELTITYTPPTTPWEPGTVPTGPTDVIAAEEGGTARNEAAGIEVTIPAQATMDDIRAVLREAFVGVAPVAQYRVAKLYDIEFKSAATGESITVFETPYTLRLTFDPTAVSEESRQSLKVYYWSEVAAVWVEIPSMLDEASSTFTVTLPHATVFAVMADTSAADTPAIASVPSTDLRGHKWLATGSGPAGASLRIVVNGVVQATTTVNEAGLWQEWVTLKEGHNWVFAATTGSTARASAEVYPVVRPVTLTDIAGHWAEDDITDLVERNVVTGYEDDAFRTESDITRAEFCALVVRALGLTPDSDGAKGFIDAEAIPAWAASFVGTAAKEGIVMGYEDNSFRADAQVTRAEMAVMIWRALKLKDISDPDISVVSFTDDGDIADWAGEGIEQASAYGIIKGYEDGSFGPDRLATRAESATMLMRLLRVK